MKRFICLTLALILTLGLVACGGSGSANTATEGGKENTGLQVGFARESIMPDDYTIVHLGS